MLRNSQNKTWRLQKKKESFELRALISWTQIFSLYNRITWVERLLTNSSPTKEAAEARDLGSAGPLKDISAPRGSVISGSTFFSQ